MQVVFLKPLNTRELQGRRRAHSGGEGAQDVDMNLCSLGKNDRPHQISVIPVTL